MILSRYEDDKNIQQNKQIKTTDADGGIGGENKHADIEASGFLAGKMTLKRMQSSKSHIGKKNEEKIIIFPLR